MDRQNSTTKYIFVTGGVVSSLGKGISDKFPFKNYYKCETFCRSRRIEKIDKFKKQHQKQCKYKKCDF